MNALNRFLSLPRWGKAGVVTVALLFAFAVSGGSDDPSGPQIVRTDSQGFLGGGSRNSTNQSDPADSSEPSEPLRLGSASNTDPDSNRDEPTAPPEPTATSEPPTPVPPTSTAVPPTATTAPPTATTVPPTATAVPPTAVPATPIPPTAVPPTPIPPTPAPPPTAVPPTPIPPPPPTAIPAPQPNANAGSGCTPGYTPCIPSGGGDVDCAGGSGNGPRYVTGPVQVTGTDPYRLDGDNDGIGCE